MSSGGEHYKTTPLKSHSIKATESNMLQPAIPSSSNDGDISRSEYATVKMLLNNDPVKDSQRNSAIVADVSSTDIAPNTTALPVPNTDETVTSKPIEITTTVNNESAIASAGSDGNNEIALTFPQRLMEMLDDPQNAEMMAWLPHGRAFAIYRKREFATDVLPKYFQKAAKYSSFTRKLNRWGFVRVTRGPETGAYYHQLFRRNERRLVLQMTCHTATSTNMNNANTHTSTASSVVPKASNGANANLHAVENDAMATMMMYPNYLDPSASQYMHQHNPHVGPQYPSMGPHPQQNYGNNMVPYNMYEETPTGIDGMLSGESQYYPPTMGGLYSNHYSMPQPHGQYMDAYSSALPHHDNNTKHNRRRSVPPPTAYRDTSMTIPHYHDDTVAPSRRMSGMSERVGSSSMVATTEDDEEFRAQDYTTNESKSNHRMMTKGMSSFRPAVQHDYSTDHHHHYYPPGYSGGPNNSDEDMMLYHPPPSQLYDHTAVHPTQQPPPPPPPQNHSSTTGETNY